MSDDICPHCGLPYSPEDSRETKPRTCQCCQAWHRRDTEADGRALLALGNYLFKHGLRGLDLSCTKAAMLALDQGRAEVDRLQKMISNFVHGQTWAASGWKAQPHIAPLFAEAQSSARKKAVPR